METDKQTPESEQPEPTQPYTKPAVERIPLNEAGAQGVQASADVISNFSS